MLKEEPSAVNGLRLEAKKSRRSRVQRFRGSRLHSRLWTAFGVRIYEKSVGFVRPNPKIGAKLTIIWENEHCKLTLG